jgi:phospholipid/cholesterol/gamma-HCH transport system permease protein
MIAAIGRLGARTIARVRRLLYALGFMVEVFKQTARFITGRTLGYRVLTMQMLFTGVEALSVVATISLSLGAVIVIQGLSLLPQFGQGQLIFDVLIIVITRELGPLLTGLIVTARSGTAISTELGNMVINHEIDAYTVTGINPIRHIVVPRFLGVTLSTLVLNLYFNIFGLLGSFVVTQFFNPIRLREYSNGLLAALSLTDVAASVVKSIVFGAIIAIVATFHGLQVERASTEIPVAAIRSVGQGITLLIVANAIITLVYYI